MSHELSEFEPNDVDPANLFESGMSPRARAYMWASFVQNLVTAYVCIFQIASFNNNSYNIIRGIVPFPAWGGVFLTVAVIAAYSAIVGNEPTARVALIASATAATFWSAAFVYAYFDHHLAGPTPAVAWGALAIKDLIVCRQPLRSPFEAIIREFTGRTKVG